MEKEEISLQIIKALNDVRVIHTILKNKVRKETRFTFYKTMIVPVL